MEDGREGVRSDNIHAFCFQQHGSTYKTCFLRVKLIKTIDHASTQGRSLFVFHNVGRVLSATKADKLLAALGSTIEVDALFVLFFVL